MTDTESNLQTLQNLNKILARIVKSQVNIAIFIALIQTVRGFGLVVEEITKNIYETFGDGLFGKDEIRDRLNRLVIRGWIEKNYRIPDIKIAPYYEYNLSVDGQIIAKFFKEMMESLNYNILKEE